MTSSTNDSFMYFAYGSNLSQARIHLNNPSAEFYAVAKLKDYKLVFGCQEHWKSNRWHGGVASIEEQQGEEVWGVIWKLHNRDMANLDKQEVGYRAIDIQVTTTTSDPSKHHTCRTYELLDKIDLLPSPQYVEVITNGAVQAGLPSGYVKWLHRMEHNGYDGPMEIMSKLGKEVKADEKDL